MFLTILLINDTRCQHKIWVIVVAILCGQREDTINQRPIDCGLLTGPVDDVNERVETRKPCSSELNHKMSHCMLTKSLPWFIVFLKFCVDLAA